MKRDQHKIENYRSIILISTIAKKFSKSLGKIIQKMKDTQQLCELEGFGRGYSTLR